VRPAILQLDDALQPQARLRRRVSEAGGRTLAALDLGPRLRLWSRRSGLAALRDRLADGLPALDEPELVFAGSGDFHHVTPLLLERAIARFGGPVTVLHFDNHPDWVRQAAGRHCGSWVGVAARLPGVEQVITIGPCSPDVGGRRARQGDLSLLSEGRLALYAWAAPDGGEELVVEGRSWPTVSGMGEAAFLDHLVASLGTRRIYVTLDKDVLAPADAVTNWDQGQASLDFVLAAIARAAADRQLIGADVVGDWSRPIYGGDLVSQLLRRAEALLDQPRGRAAADAGVAVNEAANLRLLDLFAGLGA
jgi:hypothetical protein